LIFKPAQRRPQGLPLQLQASLLLGGFFVSHAFLDVAVFGSAGKFFVCSGFFAGGAWGHGGGFGAQAGLHEGFALIAFFVASVGIAGGHFALLFGFAVAVSGVRDAERQCQTHGKYGEQLFHDVPCKWLSSAKSSYFPNPGADSST
jgi:hypothetical protein